MSHPLHDRIDLCASMHGSPVIAVSSLCGWLGVPVGTWPLYRRNLPPELKPSTFLAGHGEHMFVADAVDWCKKLVAADPKRFGVEP